MNNSYSGILWMLLTALSVPIDKGIAYIGIEKDLENLFRFVNALEIYQYSWVEPIKISFLIFRKIFLVL